MDIPGRTSMTMVFALLWNSTVTYRNHAVRVGPGEMIVVPRGVDHRPVAESEVHVLLFEPATTLNTGNVENERTVRDLERL